MSTKDIYGTAEPAIAGDNLDITAPAEKVPDSADSVTAAPTSPSVLDQVTPPVTGQTDGLSMSSKLFFLFVVVTVCALFLRSRSSSGSGSSKQKSMA